jgi:hypothetical protein
MAPSHSSFMILVISKSTSEAQPRKGATSAARERARSGKDNIVLDKYEELRGREIDGVGLFASRIEGKLT